MRDAWVWVSLHFATFGLHVRNGVVVEAPPIARWAVGRPEREVADYYRRRGAEFRVIPGGPPTATDGQSSRSPHE